jgi:hypothetical protein
MRRSARVSHITLVGFLLVGLGACRKAPKPMEAPLAVRVFRNRSSQAAGSLVRATQAFVKEHRKAADGRGLMISMYDSASYTADLQRLPELNPQIVILDSEADLAADAPIRVHLGDPEPVCGAFPAYLPDWSQPAERDTALLYLQFLRDRCSPIAPAATPVSATPGANPPAATSDEPAGDEKK